MIAGAVCISYYDEMLVLSRYSYGPSGPQYEFIDRDSDPWSLDAGVDGPCRYCDSAGAVLVSGVEQKSLYPRPRPGLCVRCGYDLRGGRRSGVRRGWGWFQNKRRRRFETPFVQCAGWGVAGVVRGDRRVVDLRLYLRMADFEDRWFLHGVDEDAPDKFALKYGGYGYAMSAYRGWD